MCLGTSGIYIYIYKYSIYINSLSCLKDHLIFFTYSNLPGNIYTYCVYLFFCKEWNVYLLTIYGFHIQSQKVYWWLHSVHWVTWIFDSTQSGPSFLFLVSLPSRAENTVVQFQSPASSVLFLTSSHLSSSESGGNTAELAVKLQPQQTSGGER